MTLVLAVDWVTLALGVIGGAIVTLVIGILVAWYFYRVQLRRITPRLAYRTRSHGERREVKLAIAGASTWIHHPPVRIRRQFPTEIKISSATPVEKPHRKLTFVAEYSR